MHLEQAVPLAGGPPLHPMGVRPLYVLLIALLLHVVLNHVFHASSVVLSHLVH